VNKTQVSTDYSTPLTDKEIMSDPPGSAFTSSRDVTSLHVTWCDVTSRGVTSRHVVWRVITSQNLWKGSNYPVN